MADEPSAKRVKLEPEGNFIKIKSENTGQIYIYESPDFIQYVYI